MNGNNIKGIGNAHVHHVDVRCLPEKITKQQSGFPEWINKTIVKDLAKLNKYMKEFIKVIGEDKYLEPFGFHKISEYHANHMEESGIDYSIVLVCDYTYGVPEITDPAHLEFSYVVQHAAKACAKYPFQFYLFFGFDPRSPHAVKKLKESYNEYGYVGIKFYPAMGFDPRPDKISYIPYEDYFPYEKNDIGGKKVLQNIQDMYDFAKANNLPILVHCSAGGTYMATVKEKEKYQHIWRYTEPSNFINVVNELGLRLCFGHMGGKANPRKKHKDLEIQWHNQILNLITLSDGWSSPGRFFADLSYNIIHLIKRKNKLPELKERIEMTKRYLEDKTLGNYILYGTDWPLNLYKCSEKQYMDAYKEIYDNKKLRDKYFSDNISKFLFGDSMEIPKKHIDFLKKENPQLKIPKWISENNGQYYL